MRALVRPLSSVWPARPGLVMPRFEPEAVVVTLAVMPKLAELIAWASVARVLLPLAALTVRVVAPRVRVPLRTEVGSVRTAEFAVAAVASEFTTTV